jgi:hypothetical protein
MRVLLLALAFAVLAPADVVAKDAAVVKLRDGSKPKPTKKPATKPAPKQKRPVARKRPVRKKLAKSKQKKQKKQKSAEPDIRPMP